MKVAFFHPETGVPVRIYSGADVGAVLMDPRYDGFDVRALEGTPYADAMSLVALPPLAEFDASGA